MRKFSIYIAVIISLITFVTACDTDIEALDIVTPYPKSNEYYANLRAYKARGDHEIFFGWFGGWSANTSSMINFLESVPDSVDVISIWGDYRGLTKKQLDDLRFVQNVKGTRVSFTVFAHRIPDEFMSGEKKEIATPEGIEAYAKSLVDTMYKYGYQGIDLDYEPGYMEFPGVPFTGPLVGPLNVWPDYMNNMEIFVKALGKYIGPKSGTTDLLIIDGVPYHLKDGLAEYFNYGVVQSYNSPGFTDLQTRFNSAAAKGWLPEQYVFTETFEGSKASSGGVNHKLREGGTVPSLEGMARFKPEYKGEIVKRKGGCGTYHMENDYFSKPINYKYTRNAIFWMNKENN